MATEFPLTRRALLTGLGAGAGLWLAHGLARAFRIGRAGGPIAVVGAVGIGV